MRMLRILVVVAFVSLTFVIQTSAQIDLRGEIKGRILSDDGRPARRVNIMVMDLTTLETREVISNDFGYFRIDNLQFGNTFLVRATAKSYYFAFPFQTVTLNLLSREVSFSASKFPPPPSLTDVGIDEPMVIESKEP